MLKPVKRIFSIPIVHTATDLGTLAEPVRRRYLRERGPAAWQDRERIVEEVWNNIRQRIDGLRLDYRAVLIYQDGLPLCGHEMEIVRELAGAGSRNHQLVLGVVQQGATLIGTEDPRLLIREYELQRRQLKSAQAERGEPPPSALDAAEILELRDRFIAGRIAETLGEGQTGLLFLGAAHRLDAMLASDIRVERLT